MACTNVECFESPFNHKNLDWYALARQKLSIPIALHLNVAADVFEAVKREACDWLNIGGPLVNTYKLASHRGVGRYSDLARLRRRPRRIRGGVRTHLRRLQSR